MNDNSNNPDSTTPWLRDAADSLIDQARDAVYTEIAVNFSGDNARRYSDVVSIQQASEPRVRDAKRLGKWSAVGLFSDNV